MTITRLFLCLWHSYSNLVNVMFNLLKHGIMGNLKASYPLDPSCDYIEVDTSKVGTGIHIINLVVDGAVCDFKKDTF